MTDDTLTFRLTVRCESAAFEDGGTAELSRILRKVADELEEGRDYSHYRTMLDVNGNDVGRAKLAPLHAM